MSTSSPTGVQSLERAFTLLSLLADNHVDGLRMDQLVRAAGISRPTIHRMISFLVDLHYIEQDVTTRAYRLGTAAMLLGLRTMSRPPLVATYLLTMRRLARRTGEGVFMVVRIGDYSYNLHLEQDPPQNPALQDLVGTTRLLGLGIGSLSLLATMTDAEIRRHYARQRAQYAASNLSLTRLLTGVERGRRLGYTLAAGLGVAGVGYAFEVPSGYAAISVVSSKARMPLARRHEFGKLIKQEIG
ncbi:IclR family transcriptional regulator [Bradyrhizobium sp. AS23.2]|nr:helix-turn-helix domain-containing protein [Bradyrhizobium sp. AS23.2]OKO83052.1 IclR family transcriptional regulator [Bradyrhizobium sp. AS23.2]